MERKESNQTNKQTKHSHILFPYHQFEKLFAYGPYFLQHNLIVFSITRLITIRAMYIC